MKTNFEYITAKDILPGDKIVWRSVNSEGEDFRCAFVEDVEEREWSSNDVGYIIIFGDVYTSTGFSKEISTSSKQSWPNLPGGYIFSRDYQVLLIERNQK